MARPRGLFGTHAEACGGIRRQALDHASAFYLDGFLAAALWLPPGVHPDHETMSALMARTVAESRLQMLDKAFKQMSASHPEEQHWYLPLIGTDPAHQSQGLGSLLMRHANAIFDRDNVLAYLEKHQSEEHPVLRAPRVRIAWNHSLRRLSSNLADATPAAPIMSTAG